MAQTPLQQATEVAKSDPKRAESILKEILGAKAGELGVCGGGRALMHTTDNEEPTRDQDAALMQLAQLYRDEGYDLTMRPEGGRVLTSMSGMPKRSLTLFACRGSSCRPRPRRSRPKLVRFYLNPTDYG